MREVMDRNKAHCFELYSVCNDVIKACKTDAEGKVIEGEYPAYCCFFLLLLLLSLVLFYCFCRCVILFIYVGFFHIFLHGSLVPPCRQAQRVPTGLFFRRGEGRVVASYQVLLPCQLSLLLCYLG